MDGEIDLTPFSVWSCAEGEEYIPQLLMNEDEESSNVNLATDCRVWEGSKEDMQCIKK